LGWIRGKGEQPWRVTVAALAGLLVAIIVVGVVGLLLIQNLERATDEALRYDVELEDNGDDLRAAVLDVRHFHRNITFAGPSQDRISDLGNAYEQMQDEIDELDRLGVRDPDTPQPDEIRRMADGYYEDFRPAIELYETDRAAFDEASERGLYRIARIESAAAEIDSLGEELSAGSLREVEQTAFTARGVLFAVIGGLLLVGAVLALSAVRVVNELRRLNAEQREAAKKLAEASRAKTDFLADVSHELRTPLTVLRGNAQVGLALGAEGEQEQLLHEVVEESRRMSRMVEDLLFLARSDSASPPMDLESVSVASLVSEIAGRAEVLTREHGATLQTNLHAEGTLQADPARVGQAVLILVDNAIKYGPPGGVVKLGSGATHSGEVMITVEDRGPGIPREDLPRIFERFYRVDKARSRKMGGTGLGLPIAKTIIQAHGGHIEVVSEPEVGTKVSLYLPLLSTPWHADRTVGHAGAQKER
jgi:two-component system, OmpR family, sensor histidine kinase VicK